MSENSKPPVWFWVVSAIALVWNLMGCGAYLAQVMMPDSVIAALPDAERELYSRYPAWSKAVFALAVWGGALGSLLLLLRKRLAFPVLIVSLVAILVQMYHSLFVAGSMEVYGPGAAVMPAMVILIGIFLVWFAKMGGAKGWLR